MKGRPGAPAVALALLAALGIPGAARGSVFELFGAGGRSVGMAGAMTAAAHGAEAAFHNPAMLADSAFGGMTLGVAATHFDLDADLQRPICLAEQPVCRARHGSSYANRAPRAPHDSGAFQLGWHAPVGGALDGRVVLGAMMTLPLRKLIHIAGPDPQTPHYYMYEGLPDRLSVLLSAAWQPTDWLSVGLGTQVLASLSSDVTLLLDVNNHTMQQASVQIALQPVAGLTAGVMVRPLPGWRLGLSFRQEISLRYEIPSRIDIGQTAGARLAVQQNTLYSPSSVHAGASWRSPGGDVLIAIDGALALWSSAPDPSPRVEIDVGGGVVDGMGLGGVIDIGREAPPIDLRFRDTWTPSVGAEWQVLEPLLLRAGYALRPTPAPRATGPFNYLDNTGHVLACGLDWGFGQPVRSRPRGRGNLDEPLRADAPFFIRAGVQLVSLARRTVRKLDPNDPVGDFEHGGRVLHATLAVGGTY